jgi:hypothetical protein
MNSQLLCLKDIGAAEGAFGRAHEAVACCVAKQVRVAAWVSKS